MNSLLDLDEINEKHKTEEGFIEMVKDWARFEKIVLEDYFNRPKPIYPIYKPYIHPSEIIDEDNRTKVYC